jgi:hypothetical protein
MLLEYREKSFPDPRIGNELLSAVGTFVKVPATFNWL